MYGVRPSQLIGLPPTSQGALAFDMAVAIRAESRDIKEGTGEYWWLSVLKAFTKRGGGQDEIHWL